MYHSCYSQEVFPAWWSGCINVNVKCEDSRTYTQRDSDVWKRYLVQFPIREWFIENMHLVKNSEKVRISAKKIGRCWFQMPAIIPMKLQEILRWSSLWRNVPGVNTTEHWWVLCDIQQPAVFVLFCRGGRTTSELWSSSVSADSCVFDGVLPWTQHGAVAPSEPSGSAYSFLVETGASGFKLDLKITWTVVWGGASIGSWIWIMNVVSLNVSDRGELEVCGQVWDQHGRRP